MSTGPNPQLPTTFVGWAIWLVIVIAICGVVYVILGMTGVVIPAWIITIGWICLAAFIVVGAIKFISRLG